MRLYRLRSLVRYIAAIFLSCLSSGLIEILHTLLIDSHYLKTETNLLTNIFYGLIIGGIKGYLVCYAFMLTYVRVCGTMTRFSKNILVFVLAFMGTTDILAIAYTIFNKYHDSTWIWIDINNIIGALIMVYTSIEICKYSHKELPNKINSMWWDLFNTLS